MLLLPIGADHLCPPRNLKTQVRELNKHLKDYEIKIGTPFDYFKLVQNNYKQRYDGEFLDNSKTFILKGSYSCCSYIKQQNAYAQWLLGYLAEPLNKLCKGKFQKEIDYAYKLIIQNHAHDSIYGCSTDDVDFEVQARYKKANQVSNGIIKRLLRDKRSKGFNIANLANFEYSGAVEIESEKPLPKWLNAQKIGSYQGFLDSKLYNIDEIPVTEDYANIKKYLVDVKNLSPKAFTELKKDNINTVSALKITDKTLENDYLKLTVKAGNISILDKKPNKEYKNILTFEDRTDLGDSYNFAPKKGGKPVKAVLQSVKILEKGHIRSTLQLKYKLKK